MDSWRTPDWLLTDSWPTPDGLLMNSWPTIDRLLTDYWLTPDRLLTDSWPTPDRLLTDSWLTTDGLLTDSWRTPDRLLIDYWPIPDQLQEINLKVSIWRAVPIELSNDDSPLAPIDSTDPEQIPCLTSNWSWLTSWLTLMDILWTPGGPRLTLDGPSTDPPDRPLNLDITRLMQKLLLLLLQNVIQITVMKCRVYYEKSQIFWLNIVTSTYIFILRITFLKKQIPWSIHSINCYEWL